jgi:hypothetical protein
MLVAAMSILPPNKELCIYSKLNVLKNIYGYFFMNILPPNKELSQCGNPIALTVETNQPKCSQNLEGVNIDTIFLVNGII